MLKRTILIIIVITGMCAAIIHGYLSANAPVVINAEDELPLSEEKYMKPLILLLLVIA